MWKKPARGSSAFVRETFERYVFNGASWESEIPFGESPTGGDTLTWDGNTEGLANIGGMFFKVSDAVLSYKDFADGFQYENSDGVKSGNQGNLVSFSGMTASVGNFYSIPGSAVGVDLGEGFIAPESGIYFSENMVSLTIPGYTGFPSVKKLDEKYMPEDLSVSWHNMKDRPFGEEVTKGEAECEEYTFTSTDGYYTTGMYLPGASDKDKNYPKFHGAGKLVIVFDGVEYVVVSDNSQSESSPYITVCGNKALYNGNHANEVPNTEDTGEPFFVLHYSYDNSETRIYTVDDGDHTISIYYAEETVIPLDEKYMPLLSDSNGKQYKLTVSTDGTLSATAV